MEKKQISVVDLFCGIGGLTYGLYKSGLKINAGIDIDESCKYAFESNCNAKFITYDINNLDSKFIKKLYNKNDIKVLTGCAPCQPFSSYTFNYENAEDKRWNLLYKFSEIINDLEPDIVSMENVPQLLNYKKAPVFEDFIKNLENKKYKIWYKVIYSPDYGIPQKRKRLVLLASKLKEIKLINPTHSKENYITVLQAIGHLEPLKSGEESKTDFIHKASKLSDKNLERIRQSKPGGSWKRDWRDDLKLDCHKKDNGKSYVSIYGRMNWDEPSPTMTTFCTGIGNGRFGHPEQDRAISLREASILQSFPITYKFCEKSENIKFRNLSKHIGNAVPPKLGEVIGISIIKHVEEVYDG